MQVTILGAGLAGLSCSYHLGHDNCVVFEAENHTGGHIYSHLVQECTWDEGPHISFTKSDYVRKLFEESTAGKILEYEATIGNWLDGHWIPHPAQLNLYAAPKSLAKRCLDDFLRTRKNKDSNALPQNYGEWLDQAFGNTFATEFTSKYTRKYWTCEPQDLETDWIGQRVQYPDVDSVKDGFERPPTEKSHYISKVRYPQRGGFYAFSNLFKQGANVHLNKRVNKICLHGKTIYFCDGSTHKYETLINTIPLDEFIRMTAEASTHILNAADSLSCTSALLINITGESNNPLPYHWLYVYDEDFASTRITQNQLLSPNNMKEGQVGLQVEIYGSKYKPFPGSAEAIASKVIQEVARMGLVEKVEDYHIQRIRYANVIFDHHRKKALDTILDWLTEFGLKRSNQDLDPMTEWDNCEKYNITPLNLAGRFGEWKYHWSDDCVLRGKQISGK